MYRVDPDDDLLKYVGGRDSLGEIRCLIAVPRLATKRLLYAYHDSPFNGMRRGRKTLLSFYAGSSGGRPSRKMFGFMLIGVGTVFVVSYSGKPRVVNSIYVPFVVLGMMLEWI